MRLFVLMLGAILGTILVMADMPFKNVQAQTEQPPLSYKLAVIDAGGYVTPDGIETRRAQKAIAEAMVICDAQQETVLVDQVVKVVKLLKETEIYARPVEILEGIKAIHTGNTHKIDCVKAMSDYMGVRHGGMTHSETVAALRVLINTIRQAMAPGR